MNRFFGVIFIMLATIGATYSQVYESVYENSNSEVRAKLDQNKIQGIDILTGVFAQHNIKLSAIDNNGKTELTNLLNENNQVRSEERRVGKECRIRCKTNNEKDKAIC